MAIPLLSDDQAYYIMMSTIHHRYGYYEIFDEEDFDHYTSQLCGIIGDRKNKKMIKELENIEQTVNESKRFIEVILSDINIEMENQEQDDQYYLFFYKVKLISSLFTIVINVKSGESYVSKLTYKVRTFPNEELKLIVYQKRISKSNLAVIKKLIYRYKVVTQLIVPLRSVSISSGRIENISHFNRFLNGISFKMTIKFCKEVPFQYETSAERSKRQFFSDAKYCADFEEHLKLYKYISSKPNFDHYTDLIKIVMREHLFQTDLLPCDDKICLDLVRDEGEGKQIDLQTVKLMLIERGKIQVEKKKEGRGDIIFSDHKEDIFLSVLKQISSKQMIDTGIDEKCEIEFKVHPSRVCVQRLKEWTIESDWSEMRFHLERPFTEDIIEAEFLDDFDLTTDDTCIWSCRSVFGYPFFVRIHNSPSFFLWNLDSWVRRFAIFIYSNHVYRVALNLIIMVQLILLYWAPLRHLATKYDYCFLLLYTFDLVIASIGKGLVLNDFAYLSDSWNLFDTFVTFFSWLQKMGLIRQFFTYLDLFIQSNHPISDNYSTGFGRFLVIVRISRLVRDVRNILFLQEMRTIISVLINLVPKMIPMVILIVLILMCISALIMQSGVEEMFYNVCWPVKYNLQELEEKVKIDPNLVFNELFEYDFYPCSQFSSIPLISNCPPAETCQKVSEQMRLYIKRTPIDNLSFNKLSSTWLLLFMLLNAEDYDPQYYVLQEYLGIISFVINGILFIFGFYVLAIFLGIISDTYETHIEASRKVFANIKYHENEAEFSHDISETKVVLYRFLKKAQDDYFTFGHHLITARSIVNEEEKVKVKHLLLSNLEDAYRLFTIEHKSEEKFSTYWVDMDKVEHFCPVLITFEKIAERIRRFNQSETYQRLITLVIIVHGVVYLIFRSYINAANRQEVAIFMSEVESIFTIVYIFEILLNLFCYGFKYYRDYSHAFDLFVVFCNIIHQFDAFGSDYLLGFTYLRLCRILGVLVQSWSALRFISMAVTKSFGFFITTILVFLVIFVYLGLLTTQLFDSIHRIKTPNFLVSTFSYQYLDEALFTVFAQLFMALWQDVLLYYIEYGEKNQNYQELLPFSFEIFVVISYFGQLIFRDLFVPQLLSNVAISKMLFIQKNSDTATVTYESLTSMPVKVKKTSFKTFGQFWSSLSAFLFTKKFKNSKVFIQRLFSGHEVLYFKINQTWLKSGFFFLNIVDNIYTFLESCVPFLKIQFYLQFGLLLKLMLGLEIVSKVIAEGFGEYFYGKRSGLKSWKIFRSFIDIATVLVSFISILFHINFGYHYPGRSYFKIVSYLSYLRLIDFIKPIKLKMINFLRHIKGIFNILLFCSFIILICDIIGLQIFVKNQGYCLSVSNRYGADRFVPSSDDCDEMLKQNLTSEVFYDHKTFNFQNIALGFLTIIQLIYGDSFLATVKTLIKYERSFQPHDSQIWAWSFIVLIIFIGPIVDALIFSAISEVVQVEDVFDETSIWGKLKSKQSALTYLAISKIKYVTPWSILDVSQNRIHTMFLELLSSPLWDNLCLIFLVFNISVAIFEIVKGLNLVPDYIFLIAYFIEGLFRLAVVGSKYLKYPFLLSLDFILPTILLALHLTLTSEKQIRWSMLIFLRLIAPDRYVKFKFLSRSKIIISAIISSLGDQVYVFGFYMIFIIAFANLGLEIFQFSDVHGAEYAPYDTPLVYRSLPSAVIHLFVIGFGHFFDIALINLEIRSKFCLKKVDPLNSKSSISRTLTNILKEQDLVAILRCQNQELLLQKHQFDILIHKIQSSINNDYALQTIRPFYINTSKLEEKFDVDRFKLMILLNLTLIYQFQAALFDAKLLSQLRVDEIKTPQLYFDRKFCPSIRSTHYHLLNDYFNSALTASIKFEKLEKHCATQNEIRTFYFVFMLFSKLIFLNILKSIVMKHYGREKQTVDIDFSENDIAEYIQSWHKFANRMGKYGSYLPLKYAYFFIKQEAPFHLRLSGKSEEQFQLVLVKYQLPIREEDMFVHAFDIFMVAVASNFDCPVGFDFKIFREKLMPYILKIYPDYQSNNKILMSQFIAGYYFGTIALQANLQSKLKNTILIKETNILESLKQRRRNLNKNQIKSR